MRKNVHSIKIKENPKALQYIDPKLKTVSFLLSAIKINAKALEYIDIYKDDATINGLTLDINLEERTVELFAENIINAGKAFLSNPMEKPFIPSWKRIEYASPGFIKKLRQAVYDDNQ